MRSGLVTVLRTMRSNRGAHESLFFFYKAVLETKRIVKITVRDFSGRTVQSDLGFKTLQSIAIGLGCMSFLSHMCGSYIHGFTSVDFT